jgi:hypothetical protein
VSANRFDVKAYLCFARMTAGGRPRFNGISGRAAFFPDPPRPVPSDQEETAASAVAGDVVLK